MVVLALVAMATFGCVREEEVPQTPYSNAILFKIAVDNGFVAKSADEANEGFDTEASSCFFGIMGKDSVTLYASEHSNAVQWAVADTTAAETKGAPIMDGALDKFYVSAKVNNGNVYFADEEIEVSSLTSNRFWPNAEPLNFFAYAPAQAKMAVDNFTLQDDKWLGTFTYTMPKDNDEGDDAEDLPDYIYSITSGRVKDGGAVALEFHHAFSAICFKVGNIPDNTTVNYISLNNIHSDGICSFEENADTGILFTWENTTNKESFKQNLVYTGEDLNPGEQTFMVVPQTLPEGAEIEVGVTLNGTEYTYTKPIKDITAEWLADKMYVYRISIPDEINIEIEDQVSGAVKSNVQMQNTGSSPAYIRALVLGAWVVGNQTQSYIVSTWKETDGDFVYSAEWSNYWIKGTDGFYYYKYPLSPGQVPAVPLFETYTLTVPPPYERASLQLNVMAQGVIATAVKGSSWPWPYNLSNGLEENEIVYE